LKEAFGDKFEELELVNADLNDADSIKKAIDGCDYVIHVASPFPAENPADENELIDPAVNGTIAVMEGCKEHGVKRVVITSSCAAIEQFNKGDMEVDETYFAEIHKDTPAYYKSKILAEKAAWDFYDNLDEEDKEKLGLVVMNPGFVMGPLLVKADGTSQKLITGLMDGSMAQLPYIFAMVVDVRDVADAHLKGLTCEPGNRYVLTEGNYNFGEIADILIEEFNGKGFNIRFSYAPKFLLWILSFFSSDVNMYYQRLGVRVNISSKKAQEQLGIKFKDLKTTTIDMGYSLIEHGYVKAKK